MTQGPKMILGVLAILLLAYVVGSIFFPQIIKAMNLTPIKLRFDTF